MRLFIAIELPKSFRKEIAAVQAQMRAWDVGGRYVPAGNFHITLHFIGESNDLAGAAAAMGEAVRGIRPFNLHLAGYGSFARKESETAFLRLGGELDELNALYESLQAALFEEGFSREHKRFTPHITLCRDMTGGVPALSSLAPNASVRVEQIVLFESRREQNGMVYLPLHRQRF